MGPGGRQMVGQLASYRRTASYTPKRCHNAERDQHTPSHVIVRKTVVCGLVTVVLLLEIGRAHV